jgi:hypothetical protein
MAEETPKPRQVPIEWRIPDYIVSRYATNMVVQKAEHEYIISFFELQPPIILEETANQLASMPADCVARIVVSASKYPEFVAVLQQHLQKVTELSQENE